MYTDLYAEYKTTAATTPPATAAKAATLDSIAVLLPPPGLATLPAVYVPCREPVLHPLVKEQAL